jgi:DDT domain
MPILHGAENWQEKPKPKKILLEGERFERLLHIWEFFNNFNDFLDISNFKLEEL